MKIEKLNDNQIRCTLTPADLAARQLKLSELAYGTEKTRSLFHDMMQQASFDFGFDAEDTPLMIEAIPASDSLVLIITKVEDPEELDTRFSKFTPTNDMDISTSPLGKLEGAEEFLNLLDKVKEATADTSVTVEPEKTSTFNVRLFSFEDIDGVILVAHLFGSAVSRANTLYRNPSNGIYVLALTQSKHSIMEFNKICNMLSEYGSIEKATPATLAFLEEHCEVTISSDAIQKLAQI